MGPRKNAYVQHKVCGKSKAYLEHRGRGGGEGQRLERYIGPRYSGILGAL